MFIHTKCGQRHDQIAVARLCERGETTPCTWMIEYTIEGERYVRDCGAPAWETARGWECQDGHGHVYAEIRDAEGWDYAADSDEAGLLAGAGVDPVAMNGGSVAANPVAMRHAMAGGL
jgi:hypothetical protein